MIKNNYYTFKIDKSQFYKIVETIGINQFKMELILITFYDKENLEFSSPIYPYQELRIIEKKVGETIENTLVYEHNYPENEPYTNQTTSIQTNITEIENFKQILREIGFKILGNRKEQIMTINFLEEYEMSLKIIDDFSYEIRINTLDDHYIKKEDYEEINQYLEQYQIENKEDIF